MANVLVENQSLSDIADAIRDKLQVQTTYKPAQMAAAIASIATGGAHVYEGTSIPSASLGVNGDLYKRSFPIPQNMTFYEYLRNNNGAYINTGIYATQDIDIVGTIDRSKGTGCGIGVRTGSFSGMSKAIYLGAHTDSSNAMSCIKTKTSQSGTTTDVPGGVITRSTKTIVDNNGYYIYYSYIKQKPTYSKLFRQEGTWTSDSPICLFSYYQGTSLNIVTDIGAICRVTIYDKNVPVMDLLPCKDGNGIECMYDVVSGIFFYNGNTDRTTYFDVGNAITPTQLDDVYYLKQNGAWVALV